jgi:hypothetical protein
MTTQEIIYLSFGLVIAFLYGQYKRYKSKYNSVNVLYTELKSKKDFIDNKINEIKEKSKKRRARYVSEGWSYVKEREAYKEAMEIYNEKLAKNPNYKGEKPKKHKEWDVIYIIEEMEKVDNSSRFRPISVSSTESKVLTQTDIDHYMKNFAQRTGGWLRHDNENLKWLVDKTQKEKRNDLINNILEE